MKLTNSQLEYIERQLAQIKNALQNKKENVTFFLGGLALGIIGNLAASIIHQEFLDKWKKYYLLYVTGVIVVLIWTIYPFNKYFHTLNKMALGVNKMLKKIKNMHAIPRKRKRENY